MKLDSQKTCTIIAAVFFAAVSAVELTAFGTILDAFSIHWLSVSATVIVCNAAIWFFAIKYCQAKHTQK